jgi:hypothetical protein
MWIVDNVDKSVHKSFLAEIKVFFDVEKNPH